MAQDISTKVHIKGQNMKKVETFIYLGVIISTDNGISHDIDRATTAFLKQFNSIYHKFHYTDDSVLNFLFRTYTTHVLVLWSGTLVWLLSIQKYK